MARMARPKAISRVKETKMPATSRVGRVTRTERWSVLQSSVAKDWMKNRRPPVARSWLMGGLCKDGRDDEQVHEHAEQRADADRGEPGEPERPAVAADQEVDGVHAERDQVHVGDPHDVDDAEDQVEPEGQEREDAAEQDAVDHRLHQEDRIDHAPEPDQ